MLTAEKLHKRFGATTALDALDLIIAPGEIYALLGANGAGKTTTINLFLGFLQPDGGSLSVAGVNPASDPLGARALLAYIPEQVNLYPSLSGMENLRYFSKLAGHVLSTQGAATLLLKAGLIEQAHRRPLGEYSKGMRQKVGVAIALAKDARVMLLDEPTSGLDPVSSHEFSELLQKLAAQGITILMATHDLYRAREVASRVGVMRAGRLCAEVKGSDVTAGELERLYIAKMAESV